MTWAYDVMRGKPSSIFSRTHSQKKSRMACHHGLWISHMLRRCRAWHAIMDLELHTQFDNVGRGMPLWTLGSTHDRTTSGVACHHGPWTTHTVERRRAWHAIIAFGRQIGSKDVRRGMPSSLLNQLTKSDGVGRGMPSSP